ncbi:hypothetical protein OSB04_019752 [Centaurea solstitialis]|uniref:CCHC-type domain-containing protein n=1 Tax=Centaurea solstitialis TaxID=347529 RepID=A0AA38SSK5_9ASTR|nr:hypothetical protein OSB04_019752 [Centaurea solstitialis]
MASTVTSTDNLSLRSILEKDKLTGSNFLDWERNLMIVLRHERKWYVLEEPLGEAPPANAPAAARNAHKKHSDDLLDVACLMLATMSPDLQAGLINTNAYDMIRQLRDMFQTQARTERYDATKAFNECKMVRGTSVSDHVMKMKRHLDHLERLGHPVPLQLATDTILNSLSEDYRPFVVNYNMNNMEKTIAELHSMLKTAELNMGNKNKTKDVLMVKDGGVRKKNGQASTSKGKGPVQAIQSAPKKGKGKGKGKKVKPNKARTENRCFICNEIGHWRQNCPKRHEAGMKSGPSFHSKSVRDNLSLWEHDKALKSFNVESLKLKWINFDLAKKEIKIGMQKHINASNAKQDRSIHNKRIASMIAKLTDVVHARERIMVEEDRISNLPNEIIYHILSFLDMKYAIQTSVLSKKWKHIWTSMPHLNLNSQTSRTLPLFAKFVNDALSHRNHRTEVSTVELSFRGAATQFGAVVTSIVNYAYSHNVRKLTIEWFRLNNEVFEFPQRLFSSHTLKHLTLATHYLDGSGIYVPQLAWNFPALETLNLSNLTLSDPRYKILNLFSKCVNLKILTLHHCSMSLVEFFNVCTPQLSNLTITDPYTFPKVFNVVAPQLQNLTASVCDISFRFLQLSLENLNCLEKVNLSMRPVHREEERYAPGLQDLFQKLCGAKFLILDNGIIKVLSACLDHLSYHPCPFGNLKCLKQKDRIPIMPIKVRDYLLESSPSATFVMDLPQVREKRSREEVDKGTMAEKVSNIIKVRCTSSREEVDKGPIVEQVSHKRSRQEADKGTMANTLDKEKQQTKTMDKEKRMLEAKICMQDKLIVEKKAKLEATKLQNEMRMMEAKILSQDKVVAQQKLEEKMLMQDKVIAEQNVMLETMKLQMFEAKIRSQDKIIAQQKAMLEAMTLQHEKIETELSNIDS